MNAELKLAAEGNVDALRQWLRAHPDRINATYGVSQYTLLYTTVLHSNKVALASLASGSNAYLDTVRMLCEEFHADAGAPNGGSHNTVVHLAADMEALEILRYLLFDYHAPLLRNVFNETPLDVAVRAGKAKSIALLKQRMGEAEAEGRTPPNNNNNTTNTNSSSGNTSATPTPTRHDPTHMAELLGARGGLNNNNNNNMKGAHAKSYSSAESNHSHAEPAPPVSPGLSAAAAAAASGGGGGTNATRMQTMWATRRHRSGAGEKAKSHGGQLPQMSAGVGPAGLEEKNRSTRHPPVRRHMSSLPGNTSHAAQSTRSTSPPMNHSLRLQPTGLSAGREEEEEHEDENEDGEEEAKDVVRPATSGAAWYNNNNNNDRRSANTSVALFTVNDWADAPDPPRTRPGTTPLQPPSQAFGPATAAAAPPPPHRINTRHASQPLARPPPRGKHNTNTNITGTMGQSPPTGQAFPRHASGATAPSRSAEASFSLRERVAELRIQDDDDEDDDEGEGGEDDAVSEVQRGEGQSRNEDSNDEKEEEQEDKEAAAAGRREERAVTTYDLGTHNCPTATVTSHTAAAVAAEKTMRRSVTENPTRWANKGDNNNNNNNNNNTMRREDAAGTAHLTSSTQGIAASQRTTTSAQPIHNSNTGASATTPLNADCPSGGCAAAQCSPSPARLLRAGTLARHESDWSSCTNFESNDLHSFRAAFGNAYRITACRDHCEIKGYLAYLYKGVEYYTPVIISIYSGRPSEQSTRSGTSGALYTPYTPSQGLTSTPSERADVDRLMRASHSSAPGTPPNVLARNATSTGSNNNNNNNAAAASSSSSSYSYSRYRVMLNTELLGPYGIHRRAAYLDPLSKAFVVSPCDRTYNGLVAFLREAVIKNFQTMPPMVAETRPSAYPRYLPINRIDLSADSSSTNQTKPAGHKTSKSGGNTYIKDALPHRTQAQTRRYRILQDLSRFGDGYFNYVMGQHCVDGILPIFRETSSQTQDANSIGPRYRVLYPILGHMMESFPQSSPRHAADAAQPGSPPVYYTIPHASAGNEAVDVSCVKHVELLLYLRIRVQFTSSPSSSSSSGSPSPSSSSSSMSLYDGVPRIFLMDGRANRFMEACFARLTLPMTYTTYEPNRGGTPCELDPRALQPLLAHWNTTGSLFDLLVALRNLLTQSVKEYVTKYSSSNNNTTHTWHTAQGANVLSPLQTLFAPSSPSPSQQGNLSPSSANTAAAAAAALTAFFTPTPNPVPLAGSPLGVQQQQQQQPLAQSPMQNWFANNTTNNNANAEVQSDMMQFFGTGRPMSAYDLRMPGSDGAAMGTPVQGLYNNSNNNNMNSSSNEQGGMSYRLRCVRCMRDGVAKNALLLPCYHVALCAECVAHYQNHSRHGEFACPVCYEVVKSAYALELSA